MGVSAVFDEGTSLGEVHVAGGAVFVLRVHHVGSGRVGQSVGGCFRIQGRSLSQSNYSVLFILGIYFCAISIAFLQGDLGVTKQTPSLQTPKQISKKTPPNIPKSMTKPVKKLR